MTSFFDKCGKSRDAQSSVSEGFASRGTYWIIEQEGSCNTMRDLRCQKRL